MSALQELKTLYADVQALRAATSLMNWDRQVFMPPAGAAARSAHTAILSRMAHESFVSERMLTLLERAEPESEEDKAMLQALRRELDIQTKLPVELVSRKTVVTSDAYEVWKRAKADSNFPILAPYLSELVDIAKESAELLGYQDHPYDALINLFEFQATCADARRMFEEIKRPIVDLVRRIQSDGRTVDDSKLRGKWDPNRLRKVAQQITSGIGYRYDNGRLDVAFNAFCMNLSNSDVRMTTRPSDHVKGILSSSLHEMGHGLYEQNSPSKWDRTPLAGGISLAVHESQSRLWENIVGRSKGFWTHFLPTLQAEFVELQAVDVNYFHRAINKVQPEFVRVAADELTYNLHILVRFELEVALIEGSLAVNDLPEAWNAKYEAYLGLNPTSDSVGVLQDVHWSRGSFGYFPTYSMGNLIGAQVWACLQDDIPDTEELMSKGDFAPILGWLTDRIYSKAKTLPPRDLITQVTGRPMESAAWLSYAIAKYSEIYEI